MPTFRALALVLLAAPLAASAQELNCQVALDRQAIAGSEFGFLEEFRTEVFRYVNNRAWTDDVYQPNEQIDCQIQITFRQALTQTAFTASILVQASRPIYGTGQRTSTVRVLDDTWRFSYTRGQNLVYDPNRFNPLTSVLDFYANVVLGYDYDTFEPLGGTPYFERAQRIAELARTDNDAGQPGAGWFGQGSEDRARATLVTELLDPTFEPLRQAHFAYHFDVLDHFVLQPQLAYADGMEVLTALHDLYTLYNRRRYATDVFFGAKYQEITDLFRDAPQRNQAYALLSEMDPAHLSTYDALIGG